MSEHELTSWKEIATHLGINVRTAQRWERERRLPVRRLPGGRGRVATTITALDAWQRTAKSDTQNSHSGVVCYRWPLSKTVTAELRVTGAPLTTEHLTRLRQYLDLVNDSIQT
jgi:hypothetical protein